VKTPPDLPIPLPLRIWRGLRDPLGYLAEAERHGDVVSLRPGHSYAVFHPAYIKHVLQDNARNYEKGRKYRAALRPIMGNGIFTSEGDFWLRQRRLAQGAFRRAHMAIFAEGIRACAHDLINDWEIKTDRNEAIDLRRDLVIFTLRMTIRNLFNVEPNLAAVAPAMAEVTAQIRLGAQFLPFHLPPWVMTPARWKFKAGMRLIDQFVEEVVAKHKASTNPAEDLVSLLIEARDEETGEQMSEEQLRDELVTMLVAGHDTVTDSILWTVTLLAQNRRFLAPLRDELMRTGGSNSPTIESLKDLELMGRVIHESLRLRPPGWAFARTALHDDEIGGYRIPAGALVVISPYIMHRSNRFWDDPLTFDPDRFLPERMSNRQRFTYFPFGGGQRQCIGAGLAMIEIPLILGAILQHFDFEIPELASIVPSPRISLRPKETVWLKLRPKDAAGIRAN
jgi:cytochrome P450